MISSRIVSMCYMKLHRENGCFDEVNYFNVFIYPCWLSM